MSTIADEIVETLRRIAPDIDPGSIDRGRPLVDQLDLDSMDYQQLLAALATRYAAEIREVDLPRLRSVDDLATYIATARTL
jgi:acyl carrier protein